MTLFLLPNLLCPSQDHHLFLPISVDQTVQTLEGLFAESDKGARSFLKRFKKTIPIILFNEHTPRTPSYLDFLLEPLEKGENWGLISDAGLPCLADPGSELVFRAQSKEIKVLALSGPSSLTLSLMLSGLPSQRFTFHSYPPKKPEERVKALKNWELRSKNEGEIQVFIETPYRNNHVLESLLSTLQDQTLLCVAKDLTLPSEEVLTTTVSTWKKKEVKDLSESVAIFLFLSK